MIYNLSSRVQRSDPAKVILDCFVAMLLAMTVHSSALAAENDELRKTRAAIEEAKVKHGKLEAERLVVEDELKTLQKKLVRAAASLQRSEKQVTDAENALVVLQQKVDTAQKNLESKRTKLDGLLRISIRLSRTPPQAMILMPGDGQQRLQASQALAVLQGDMQREAEAIRKDLEDLAALQKETATQKAAAEKLRAVAAAEKKSFEVTLKERKKLRDRLASESSKEAEKLERLAQKATNLEGLLRSLSRSEGTPADEKDVESAEGISGKRGSLRSFASARGQVRIPATGRLVTRFGERDRANDTSKGITIVTRKGATVVAPYDAEVAYSGPFLNYGRLVILKHRGTDSVQFHTLLAGLERIDVESGEFLLEGEPIGAMGGGSKRDLYVELRENNQPVDPAKWMRGL